MKNRNLLSILLVGGTLIAVGVYAGHTQAEQHVEVGSTLEPSGIETWLDEGEAAQKLLEAALTAVDAGNLAEAKQNFRLAWMTAMSEDAFSNCVVEFTIRTIQVARRTMPVDCGKILLDQRKSLLEIQGIDLDNGWLSPASRASLFESIRDVQVECDVQFRRQMTKSRSLYRSSKGLFNDNELLQQEALHHLNVAAVYTKTVSEEDRAEFAQMLQTLRDELSTRQFHAQLAEDRLVIGSDHVGGGL